jgi:phosphoglycerate dehydrogenase-like enzyme
VNDRRVTVLLAYPPDPAEALVQRIRAASPRLDVLVCHYEEDHERRTARGRGEEAPSGSRPLDDSQREAFARAEVMLAFDLPSDIDVLAPRLRWVQAIGAGIDHLRSAALPEGVVLTNAAGVAAVPIAEFVLARLLGVWKRFDELEALQRAHTWKPTYGHTVAGSTLGIVGLGAIGAAVAERARAFGMRLLAVRRRPSEPSPHVDEVYGVDALHTMLAQCDAVVVCAPATPQTCDLFGAAAFDAMRRGSVFCNVARGSLVDEDALLAALRSGHLRAAILDVTRDEPLPADSDLWDAPNVYLSPHSSASIDRYLETLYELFADNVGRYLCGEPLRNVVDRDAGY